MKVKEASVEDFYKNIQKAWTWAKLTNEEKVQAYKLFKGCKLFGNYKQRIEMLNHIYLAFLFGCGYKPQGWREEIKES